MTTTPTTPPAAPRLQAQARERFDGRGWRCRLIETATGQDLSSCDKTHRTESGATFCARRQLQALAAQKAGECWYCRRPYAAGETTCQGCQRAELTAADWGRVPAPAAADHGTTHDARVLLDAARQLEAAARQIRALVNQSVEPEVGGRWAARTLVEVRATIDAAVARLS